MRTCHTYKISFSSLLKVEQLCVVLYWGGGVCKKNINFDARNACIVLGLSIFYSQDTSQDMIKDQSE